MDNVQEIHFGTKDIGDMDHIKNMYTSITVPSAINSHSMAMGYMKQWFLTKFSGKYFKSVFIDNKNIMRDINGSDINKNLKVLKPALNISQQVQLDYNRDTLDLYPHGLNTYVRRSVFENSFFKDFKNNRFMALNLNQLQSNFTFRIKVSTRAQQIDLFEYMKMAFRVGGTESDTIDMDCHIPYPLMLQLAKDAGFKIKDDKIVNVIDFVNYMNKHSIIPVLYKFRTINGKSEFFLRLREMYININNTDQLDADTGEKQGMLENNFIVEMNTTLRIPAPKMYVYYSTFKHDIILSEEEQNQNVGLYSIKIPTYPETNENGWNVYLTTEVYEEQPTGNIEIEFKDLFEGSDIETIINYNKKMGISPSNFLNFKLYANGTEVKYTIDWNTLKAEAKTSYNTVSIVVYADLEYINDQLINLKNMNKSKFISNGY